MQRSPRELWLAFLAILLISCGYLLVVIYLGGIPAASDFFGHTLGVVGFIMMLMTETLYSFRKRSRQARWGRISSWLDFHIFTGLVGPYLVLLHTAWKFNGLAGIVMLMTTLVVASGIIGRYIYTAIPRTADGIELEAAALQLEIEATERKLASWLARMPSFSGDMIRAVNPIHSSTGSVSLLDSGNRVSGFGDRLRWWSVKLRMDPPSRKQASELERLVQRHRLLMRQRATQAKARRWLALWHTLHVPIGLALFTAAIIHIFAAVYYATLLK